MNCEFCQSPVHIWFQCPKKPDGWKPARLDKKSTAARKDVLTGLASQDVRDNSTARVGGSLQGRHLNREDHKPQAGTQALPVDTTIRKPGRPSTGFDKAAYNRAYMRQYRARKKASAEGRDDR